MHFMRKRSELLAHIQNTNSQYNLPSFEKSIARKRHRHHVAEHFPDPSVRKSIELDLELLKHYDTALNDIELYLTRHAKEHQPQDLYLLYTIPRIGKILSLVILYEIEDISRFERVQNFTSYARLFKPTKESAGKIKAAAKNRKLGNACLNCAFGTD